MPANYAGQGAKLPPAPAPPTGGGFLGSVGHAISNATTHVANAIPQQTLHNVSGSDAATSGPGYGSSEASAFKSTPQYKQAVLDVFRAQPPEQQHAIIQGALHNPTPEGKLIMSYVQRGESVPSSPFYVASVHAPGIAGDLSKIANATAGAPSFLGKLVGNFGKDLYNLPMGTVEGLYGVGKNIVTGHEANAFHMLVDPYVQLVEHPLKTFEQHPLNSALMVAAPEDMIGRGVGGVMRSGALGDTARAAASTARNDLRIGTVAGAPSPITEARSYSPDFFKKSFQRAQEKALEARGKNPNVAGPATSTLPESVQQAFNIGQQAKLRRIADEMTSTRQAAGRAERQHALQGVIRNAPPKDVRGAVTHILQGVIRSPETATEDALAEAARLKAVQTGKRTIEEIQNRKQVRDLEKFAAAPEELKAKAFDAASNIRQHLHAQDAYLVAHGLLDPNQALRSRLMPYARIHMGARYDPKYDKLVASDGTDLSTQQILDHLKANGVPDPAYVGHFPGKVAPHRFYQAYKLSRGSIANAPRTLRAFENGAYDHSFEGLAGQVASRAEAVTKASLHDKVVSRLGILKPQELRAAGENGLFTPDEARRFARASMVDDNGNRIPGSLELTPITASPAHTLGLVKDLQHPNELKNISQIELRALSNAIDDARRRSDNTRNVALIPRVAAERFGEQFAKTDSTLRSVGKVTQQFRRTVLPYSTHWMLQIGSEAGLRSLLAGVLDPRYLADGRRMMQRLEHTKEGRSALVEMVNSSLYPGGSSVLDALRGRGQRSPLDVHNPNPNGLVRGVKAFPPTRVIIAAHNRYADAIGAAMYGLEHNARLMGLGKLSHQHAAEFEAAWKNAVRLQASTLEQLATKLENDPALVAKFGRAIDDTFGKYNKFSPRVRAAVQSYAPFLPWYLNAAKYVLWHLPAHHPVASALLASLRQTINQDVQDGKQTPLNTYAAQELARISPFGIFTPPSTNPSTGAVLAGQHITGAVLPQIESAFYNLAGKNSFGDSALKGPGGDINPLSGPAGAAAAENLLEAFLPLARYAREIQEGGKPAYGTSTILSPQPKSGSGGAGAVVNRIFNPFYSFENSKKSGPAYGPQAPYVPSTSGGSVGPPGLSGGGSSGVGPPGLGSGASASAAPPGL